MDDELLRWLYHRLLGDPSSNHTADCTYSDGLIVFIHFFSAKSDRSSRWACQKRHWPLWCRRLRFPSYSQLRRRLNHPRVQQLLHQMNEELKDRLPRSAELACDSKPLVVGGFSKDPDATVGKVPDGFARGYRFHAIVDSTGVIEVFEITGLHAGEAPVICGLVSKVPLSGKVLRGDAGYDANELYQVVADAGGRLIAPRRKPGTGLGHCAHHPHRLLAIAELEQSPQGLKAHRRHRNRIEQSFAHLTNLPFGLWALPNFVRRTGRVRMWTLAKVALYHLNRVLLQEVALAA